MQADCCCSNPERLRIVAEGLLPFSRFIFGGVNMADIVGLTCTKCKHRNYVTTVNKKKQSKKLEIKKFCKFCHGSILHKESK